MEQYTDDAREAQRQRDRAVRAEERLRMIASLAHHDPDPDPDGEGPGRTTDQ